MLLGHNTWTFRLSAIVHTRYLLQNNHDLSNMRFTERQTLRYTIHDTYITKGHEFLPAIRALLSLAIALAFLLALQVSLLWIQIAKSSSTFTNRHGSALNLYPRFVCLFEGTVILLLVVLGAIGKLGALGFFLLPLLIILAVL